MTKYIIFLVVILLIVISLILALFFMDRKKKKVLVKNETKLREEGKITSSAPIINPKKAVKVKEQTKPHKSKKFGKLKVNEEALDKILSAYKNKSFESEIEQEEVGQQLNDLNNNKDVELEDFNLQEQEEEKKEQAESTSEKFTYKIQNPFNINKTPVEPVKLDEEDEDDDFADIEKAYQEFLERKKQEALGGLNNYTIEDFKRDYFEHNIDIDEILEKLSPELKNNILKFLLNKSDLTEEDF